MSAALSPRNKAGVERVSSQDQSLEFANIEMDSNGTALIVWVDILDYIYMIYYMVDMVSGLTDDIIHMFFGISPGRTGLAVEVRGAQRSWNLEIRPSFGSDLIFG